MLKNVLIRCSAWTLLAAALPVAAQDPHAAAAAQTAEQNATCTAIQPFYWEIGDVGGVRIGGGSPRDESDYKRDTDMDIASASKWWYGAYVIEKRGGRLQDEDLHALRMLSGFHALQYLNCIRLLPSRRDSETVGECLLNKGGDAFTPADRDHFFYSGGHFQRHASQVMGLSGYNNARLGQEIGSVLGPELQIRYDSPQLAAGGISSVADFSLFLRKLMAGKLKLGTMLGSDAVCANPGPNCPSAVSSPLPKQAGWNWHYSFAHWVEDDPQSGDGAYSSPGAFGFYPWIDHGRTLYGIVARHSLKPKAYQESVECGQLIRKAYVSGKAQ